MNHPDLTQRLLTPSDYERLGLKLFDELMAVHERAKGLPLNSAARKALTLRAKQLGQEIKLMAERKRAVAT
jgi:hypothetical protein